jgi:hypothetical protein
MRESPHDLHEDHFQEFGSTARRWVVLNAVIGFSFLGLSFFVVVLTIYFFLAAAGVVPPLDLIPRIPYV